MYADYSATVTTTPDDTRSCYIAVDETLPKVAGHMEISAVSKFRARSRPLGKYCGQGEKR